jgi:hypothetical protein
MDESEVRDLCATELVELSRAEIIGVQPRWSGRTVQGELVRTVCAWGDDLWGSRASGWRIAI